MSATQKQHKYIEKLIEDADHDAMLRAVFVRTLIGRPVKSDLSDLTKEEATKVIQDLLAINMGFDDSDDFERNF